MNSQRIQSVISRMREAGLSQILVTSTTSLFYLTGYWVEPHERMIALLVTGEGKLTLFGNEIFGLSSTDDLPFVPHKDGQDPVKDLAQAVSPGKLGIDQFLLPAAKGGIAKKPVQYFLFPVHAAPPFHWVHYTAKEENPQ